MSRIESRLRKKQRDLPKKKLLDLLKKKVRAMNEFSLKK